LGNTDDEFVEILGNKLNNCGEPPADGGNGPPAMGPGTETEVRLAHARK